MMFRKCALIAGLVLSAYVTQHARGNSVNIVIVVDCNGGSTHYSAGIFPNFSSSELQFKTFSLSNSDGAYISTNGGNFQTTFDSYAELASDLEEPWTLVLDSGLPTQREYSTTLNLGNLGVLDLTAPAITFPSTHSFIQPSQNIFTFTPPDLPLPMVINFLGQTPGSLFPVDDEVQTLPVGSTQWSPQVAMQPGINYQFSLESQGGSYLSGLDFSDPMDTASDSLPDWSNGSDELRLLGGSVFTTLPEPGSISALAASALLLRRRKNRVGV